MAASDAPAGCGLDRARLGHPSGIAKNLWGRGGTLPAVEADSLARAAALLRERNAIDAEPARLIQAVTRGVASSVIKRQWAAAEMQAGRCVPLAAGPSSAD